MREAPPLGVRPRPEVWDGAIQQPVVVVGLVQRDKVLDRVDEVAEQWELLRRRRAAVGTKLKLAWMPGLLIDSTGSLGTVGLWRTV